jgi:hypothetical protein
LEHEEGELQVTIEESEEETANANQGLTDPGAMYDEILAPSQPALRVVKDGLEIVNIKAIRYELDRVHVHRYTAPRNPDPIF